MDPRADELGLTRAEWGSVQALCQRYQNAIQTRSDLEQECLVAIWKILKSYQERGIPIRNRGGLVYWVSRCTILKRAEYDRKPRLWDSLFHSNIHASGGEDFSDESAIAEGEVFWERLLETEVRSDYYLDALDLARIICEFLDEKEIEFIQCLFVEGQGQQEIAGKMGVSQARVAQRKAELLAKLRGLVEQDACAVGVA